MTEQIQEAGNNSQQRSNISQQGSNIAQQRSNQDMIEKVDKILAALTGTLDGEEGLVSLVRGIHQTLHDKDYGLIPRVIVLERQSERVKGWLLGSAFVGGIIAWVIEQFTGGKH